MISVLSKGYLVEIEIDLKFQEHSVESVTRGEKPEIVHAYSVRSIESLSRASNYPHIYDKKSIQSLLLVVQYRQKYTQSESIQVILVSAISFFVRLPS